MNNENELPVVQETAWEEDEEEVQEKESPELLPNQIRAAVGTKNERILDLKIPTGKKGRRATAKLIPIVANLEKYQDGEKGTDFGAFAGMIQELWDMDEFEDQLVPFALNIVTTEGQKWLESLVLIEVFQAFIEASLYMVTGSSDIGAFTAAQKK